MSGGSPDGIGDRETPGRAAYLAGITHLAAHLPVEGRGLQNEARFLPLLDTVNRFAVDQQS